MKRRRGPRRWLTAIALALGLAGCRAKGEEGQVPAMLRHQFQTQMKTILHDVQVAEEQAAALEGRYLELPDLRQRYFNSPVPETYELSLMGVSRDAYSAEVVHKASGLSCRLEVSAGAGGGGVPSCS